MTVIDSSNDRSNEKEIEMKSTLMSLRRFLAAGLLVVVGCGSSGSSSTEGFDPGGGQEAEQGSRPAQVVEYDVVLRGRVADRDFERTARLFVAPTYEEVVTENGVNPVDVCLISGSPGANPEDGAIWFGTNSGCIPSARQGLNVDMAFVDLDGNRALIEPDPGLTGVSLNTFASLPPGDVIGLLYLIETGSIEVEISDGGVQGTVDIVGFCGVCTGGPGGNRGSYTASFRS